MDNILVITHNGKMPADGGLRLGYQVGPWVQPIAGGPLRFVGTPAPGVPRRVPGVEFSKLQLLGPGLNPRCTICKDQYSYSFPVAKMTDEGMKTLFRCTRCDGLMRSRG